jgi:hypothetical protein
MNTHAVVMVYLAAFNAHISSRAQNDPAHVYKKLYQGTVIGFTFQAPLRSRQQGVVSFPKRFRGRGGLYRARGRQFC